MSQISRVFDRQLWRYQLHGLMNRWSKRACPACGDCAATVVASKGMHSLCECAQCALLYRHPRESAESMATFYQQGYAEKGMTTELPDEQELARLMAANFAGSGKDFSFQIEILKTLGILPGMKLLDFGANWGYLSFQLKQAGYQVESFEISQPRARFGKRLGVEIHTEIESLSSDYDCVYSSHVLEHVPNPAETLTQQFAMIKPGGLVVAHTPNGSAEWRKKSKGSFQKVWGLVHPVLLYEINFRNYLCS
jgi:2-polyprenyl-3-methyl-5-hydroxy-6-metoxy-1,4-benzoquinol methylase